MLRKNVLANPAKWLTRSCGSPPNALRSSPDRQSLWMVALTRDCDREFNRCYKNFSGSTTSTHLETYGDFLVTCAALPLQSMLNRNPINPGTMGRDHYFMWTTINPVSPVACRGTSVLARGASCCRPLILFLF